MRKRPDRGKPKKVDESPGSKINPWIPVIGTLITAIATVLVAILPKMMDGANSPGPSIVSSQTPVTIPVSSSTPQSTLPSSPCPSDMVEVPAGEFIFGALESDTSARDDEKPSHKIYLDAFCIDKTEVSNQAYAKFAKTLGTSWVTDDLPAVNVTWENAKTYCKSLNRELPTEYQWEKAARGPNGRKYPWEGDEDNSRANVGNIQNKLYPIDSFPSGASYYGVLNMAGNAAEWTMDWYDSDWYKSLPGFGKNPTGPLEPGEFGTIVVRGGSMNEVWKNARTTARLGTVRPNETRDYLGFRCVGVP